jgi:hypothetical protein
VSEVASKPVDSLALIHTTRDATANRRRFDSVKTRLRNPHGVSDGAGLACHIAREISIDNILILHRPARIPASTSGRQQPEACMHGNLRKMGVL